jgi:phosphoribosylamine--glycine ligase
MRIFVVGSGGREHALGWKLIEENKNHELFFLPGNGGTSDIGKNVEVEATDLDGISDFAAKMKPDLIVVGPEDALAVGLVDRLTELGHVVFGPTAACARIESSKVFAKELMSKYDVPTAPYKVFTSKARAHAFIEKSSKTLVVKADGLAKGKGAIVTKEKAGAHAAVDTMMEEKVFGTAGEVVVIEERLVGEEASVLAITDGRRFALLPPSQDHKPVFDRDRGPNTGGMGAYCPAPLVDEDTLGHIEEVVLKRLLKGLAKEGLDYRGVLYAGLMLNEDGVFVVEFNARFGDPEIQSILPAIDAPIASLMVDAAKGNLKKTQRVKLARWAVCVVAASGGYPDSYKTGHEITGLAQAAARRDVIVFHAGTKKLPDGTLVTSGGRVLGITGTGRTLRQARRTAYEASRVVRFTDMHMRTDIGLKGLRRLQRTGVIQP